MTNKEQTFKYISIIAVVVAIMLPLLAFSYTVQLAWDQNSEEEVIGYRLYSGLSSGNYDTSEDVGNPCVDGTCEYTWVGEEDEPDTFFAVTAYNDEEEESDFSNEATFYGSSGFIASACCGTITWEPVLWETIYSDNFESGLGNYQVGGNDAFLYTGGTYAYQGNNAADIQDNSGDSSSLESYIFDASNYNAIEISFWYYVVSFDNTNENFLLEFYDGANWVSVADYVLGTQFQNKEFKYSVVEISREDYNFTDIAAVRFRCDASSNYDDVYIDVVTIKGK